METLLFIAFVSILILIISLKNSVSSKLTTLHQKIDELSDELIKIRKEAILRKPEIHEVKEEPKVAPSIPSKRPEIVKEEAPEQKREVIKEPESISHKAIITPPQQDVPKPASKPAKPGFFERNPDLEKFIGENLANKIGIGILVLGIGFFVKYAIDKDWINEIGRVFIGILCGGILLGVAHRMRKTFAAFSSVLVGGGIAVLYLTIAIAFHEYHLFSQAAAFILMVIITGFTIVLSLGYNRIELAILSILGGFASPFMVSTGEGNYVVLFTYILILDGGMLVLAYYKKWNLVNIISYVFTVILFGSWLAARFDETSISMIGGAMTFATLFYLIFFAMNIINNIKARTSFKAIEISLLLSNTFLYYAAGMAILNNSISYDYRGLFTAALGIFNFIFAFTLYKNQRVDRNLVFLLIGLVLTFISLAAPVQLEGNYITLFWAAETVLLLWLSQKSGIALMKGASVLIMMLMVISLLMDWEQIYFTTLEAKPLSIIFNKGYITSIAALISISATLFLLRLEKDDYKEYVPPYKMLLTVAGMVLLYTSQLLELRYQLDVYVEDYAARSIIIGSYNMFFLLALFLLQNKLTQREPVRKSFAMLSIIGILAYLVVYHSSIVLARDNYLTGYASFTGFGFHYVLVMLLLTLTVLSLKQIQQFTALNEKSNNLYAWFFVFFFVFIASAELDHTVMLSAYSTPESVTHILSQNHKIGYPILWGIASFFLIAIGLKKKQKHLRIISLTLLLITLVKLFLVDIKGISEGGKIAAFISLGVLLLIVSFMYQRLKRLLLADEPSEESTQNENPV